MAFAIWAAAAAWAGLAGELEGGGGVPLDAGSASSTGARAGFALGWSLGLGPLTVQPEVLGRWNVAADVIVLGAGAQAKVGGLVGFGAYAHLGIGVLGYPLPSPDAGVLLAIDPPTPVYAAVRAGWEWNHPARYKCIDCAQPSEMWLTGDVAVGFRL